MSTFGKGKEDRDLGVIMEDNVYNVFSGKHANGIT